jgi:carboxyl-terminal processing protease
LVNGFSASASEFFAGVMQDYNRALIAGNQTLGKASMQTIIPLDKGNSQDFVKVTIDKFYRVTGKSSQYTGIKPDVEMPSYLDTYLPRENSMPTALKNDSINVHIKYKKLPGSFKQIAAQSQDRIKNNPDFNFILDVNAKIDKLYTENKAPLLLTFDSVFDDVHAMDTIWKSINEAEEKEQNQSISSPRDTYQRIIYDDFMVNTNEYRVKLIRTNPYVKECINILTDINTAKSQGY